MDEADAAEGLGSFNTASGMDCMQFESHPVSVARTTVSIPQAVWIACNKGEMSNEKVQLRFQHRKRYGLHAIIRWMSHSQSRIRFQYRKRYGLHAIIWVQQCVHMYSVSIPQAVWIACNKTSLTRQPSRGCVSIPQAAWIACNSTIAPCKAAAE